MLQFVRQWIDRHQMIRPNDCILAACSGGADSLGLVHCLFELQEQLSFQLAVAHVNHRLRGAEAAADAHFVRAFAAERALPFYETEVDAAGFASQAGLALEEACRILRYRFLRETAAKLGGARIATGHHQGDQAETVLLNLLRGAGSAGLRGMLPINGDIIRPLLGVSRAQIEEYCRENHLQFRQDATNFQTDFTRNKIRLELIPYLETGYNVNIKKALCRLATLAADEHAFIAGQADICLAVETDEAGMLAVDRKQLAELPPALQREKIRQMIQKSKQNLKGISFTHVEKLLHMAVFGNVGARMELPGGIVACNSYQKLLLGKSTATQSENFSKIAPPGIRLNVPGITPVPQLGMQVLAETGIFPGPDGPWQAVFDLDQVENPVYVRTRMEGDRFQPSGMTGTKKLKAFFIDQKLPRENRDKVAIFSDCQGILWIGGYRQSDRGNISSTTKRCLRLSIINQED